MIRKSMELGFIILNPERDVSHLRHTWASVRRHYYGSEMVHILPKEADARDMKEHKELCPSTHRGGETEISMINKGFQKSKSEWCVIVKAGSQLRGDMNFRFATHMTDEKDIFFPIAVGTATDFIDASMNCLTINREFFKEIGDFAENTMWKSSEPDFNMFKMLWAGDALAKGGTFKAILGCYPR
jgi:hypothetical protein